VILGHLLFAAMAALGVDPGRQSIPTRFDGDRVFAIPQLHNGQTLTLYTDTGGGANLLCRSAAERLGLKIEPIKASPDEEAELGKNPGKARPEFRAGAAIPANSDGDANFLVTDCTHGPMATGMGDGLLSSRWFAGRIWTFDYPAHTLTLEDDGWKPRSDAMRVPIGFRQASADGPAFFMPRITIRIDGHDLDLLLDTGASGHPTAAGQSAQGGEAVEGFRATSFITTSTLEAWHTAHPDWQVIQDGDDLFAPRFSARLIRVPAVEIAGSTIGPVWFTERPDRAFKQMMSSMTDKPVEGALGGNALSHFAMAVDYRGSKAYFRCTRDCQARPPRVP
jgi:hypothetical protein